MRKSTVKVRVEKENASKSNCVNVCRDEKEVEDVKEKRRAGYMRCNQNQVREREREREREEKVG